MARKSKTRMAAGLVLALGVADVVGIYIAKMKLAKPTDIGARELAVANEPLAQPIAIRTDGELRPMVAPAFAMSAVGPRAEQAPITPRTVRVAIPEPILARTIAPPAVAAPPAFAAAAPSQPLARQTAPVAVGALTVAEKPARRVVAERRSIAAETRPVRTSDMRIAQQRIPARATRFERTPASADPFAVAFAQQSDDEVRLPEPAYRRGEPLPQASAELPALELSASQIHSEPAPDADMPMAPPATATSSDIVLPKS